MTITEFLEARITEDEAVARDASGATVEGQPGAWRAVSSGDQWVANDGEGEVEVLVALRPGIPTPPHVMSGYWGAVATWEYPEDEVRGYVRRAAKHIARHDPARVLAECAAKRAIIETLAADLSYDAASTEAIILGALAAVYKDHPEYQQEWALDG